MPIIDEEFVATAKAVEELFWSKVEKSSECWNWQAGCKRDGYGVFHVRRRHVPAHRLSYAFHWGPIPDGIFIDHICHNKRCVNPDHLRLATPKQNSENLSGLHPSNTSGYRGVSYERGRRKCWSAKVMHKGQRIHIGMFLTAEEANAAVVAKRNELYTHNDADRKAA